jgi:undecaprenyl-diphosphatase
MNDFIEDLINDWAGHVAAVDTVMKLAATDLIYLVLPLAFALWFLPGGSAERALRQRVWLAIMISVIAQLYSDARPFVSRTDTRLLISHAADNGFPSEHATVSFAVAGTLIWWRRSIGFLAIFLASLIGFARVFVGVHWPSDVAAGAAIGIVTGALAAQTVSWWTPLQAQASKFFPSWMVASP